MKNLKITLSLLLVLTMMFFVCSSVAAKNIRLKAASGLFLGNLWHVGFAAPLLEQITKDTNGDVQFNVFPSAELVKFGQELDALKQGTTDVALSFSVLYDPARFPLSEVTMLPISNANIAKITEAYKILHASDSVLKDGKTWYQYEFGDKGVVALAGPAYTGYIINTTGVPLDSVEDFSAKIKMRSPNRTVELLSRNLGLTPVTISFSECFDALSRKALDGIYMPPDYIVNSLQDLVKYAIDGLNLGYGTVNIGMTKAKWDALPPDVQKVFRDAVAENAVKCSDTAKKIEQENWDYFLSHGGVKREFSKMDPAVQKHINDASVKTWFDWIEKVEAKGHPGKKTAMLWRDIVLQVGADVPQVIKDLK